ncbi:MAG: SGNH/GDSL hydrolase family protein [Bacteroidia bacterium]|nr:SGNH/GDSL hydrolase family protein [Bacteroidia bacterium]
MSNELSYLAFQLLGLVCLVAIIPSGYAVAQTERKYLALGDSYTIGESVFENERWPVRLVKTLRINGKVIGAPTIIATTGWRTDNLKYAMDKCQLADDYDLVSLLIGVNNQYQGKPIEEYAVEFEELLKTAIKLAKGETENVFVVSIPDYGYTPLGKPKQVEISKAIDSFNAVNENITEKAGVKYINITDISRKGIEQPDLVAGDGLHPSGKMYSLWVDRIKNSLMVDQ